ncbi:MAG: transglycosylase SLT domain-containing protein [Lysobacteraceae bacterium]
MIACWRNVSTRVALAATLVLAGCQTTQVAHDVQPTVTVAPPPAPASLPPPQPATLPAPVLIDVTNAPPEISEPIAPPTDAPLPSEPDVLTSGEVLDRLRARLSSPACIVGPNNTRWRHKYAGYPQHFADEVMATLPMLLVVLDELDKHKLPGEFALIPIVESWYRPNAHGFGADGMWQMVAQTARNNGTVVIRGYDGRLSPLDSTSAAINYLEKLYAMFNDWRLAAMAYNLGEYRVMRTMSDNELRQRSVGHQRYRRPDGLSGTTYEYVSKLRALTCLLAQPERQSIPLATDLPVVHWVPYTMPANISSLDELARILDTDPEELKKYNAGYRLGRIIDGAPRTLLVPASTRPHWPNAVAQDGADATAAIAGNQPADSPADPSAVSPPAKKPKVARIHTVVRGETLVLIARHYHVSVDKLRAWNHLGRHAVIKTGQKLRLAP